MGSLFQSAKMMAVMNLYNHMRDIPGALMKMERKLMEQGCVSSNQLVDCKLWRVVSLFWWPLEFYGFIVEDCDQNPFNQSFLCEGRKFYFFMQPERKIIFSSTPYWRTWNLPPWILAYIKWLKFLFKDRANGDWLVCFFFQHASCRTLILTFFLFTFRSNIVSATETPKW